MRKNFQKTIQSVFKKLHFIFSLWGDLFAKLRGRARDPNEISWRGERRSDLHHRR